VTQVVQKESAVLGWSNEIEVSMGANHSSICKFKTRKDPRYRKVWTSLVDIAMISPNTNELRES
jgi:hypothetical protein